MRAIFFLFFLYYAGFSSFSQSSVFVGTGTGNTTYQPVYGLMDYGWSKMIYTKNEIGRGGKITHIAFNVSNTPSNYLMNNQRVFLGHKSPDTLSGISAPDTFDMLMVYEGSMTYNGSGWHTVTLQTPFFYDSSQNLVVVWHNYDGSGLSTNYPRFFMTNTSDFKSMWSHENAFFPRFTGSWTSQRLNIRITFAALSYNYNDAGVTAIDSPATPVPPTSQPVRVKIKNYGLQNLQSLTINWQVDTHTVNTYNWSGNIARNQSTYVTVGNHTFRAGEQIIKAWTRLPNNVTDSMPSNDTFKVKVYGGYPMSGTYSIGTGKDFPNISSAIENLNGRGVSAAVNFLIDSGYYYERFSIKSIKGASSVNTITIRSASGDSSEVVIYQPSSYSTTDNYVINLDGASYIRLKNLTIKRDSLGSYATVISLMNGANHNLIENCRVIGYERRSALAEYAVIFNHATTVDQGNIIRNNYVRYGSTGIYFSGTSQAPIYENANIVENNTVEDFSYAGIFMSNQINSIIRNNSITSHNSSSIASTPILGIRLYDDQGGTIITANRIHMRGHARNEGISLDRNTPPASRPILVANNFITQTNGNSYTFGINSYNSGNINIYHNSINITAGSTTLNSGIYINTATTGSYSGINILNNILVNTGGGYAIEVHKNAVSRGNINRCDYNNLYVSGPSLGRYNDTLYSSLSAWSNRTKYDTNSLSVDPLFTSVTDLSIKNSDLKGKATPLSEVTTDIDGYPRDPLTPDIGAQEFETDSFDLALVKWIHPTDKCGLGQEDLTVMLINRGRENVSGFTLSYRIHTDSAFVVDTVNSLLKSRDTLIHTFSQKADYTLPGYYHSEAVVHLSNDQNRSNDSLKSYLPHALSISSFPFVEDFERENYYFIRSNASQSNVFIDTASGMNSTAALKFEGREASGWEGNETTTDSSRAWVSNSSHHATAKSCFVDATALSQLKLRFNLRQQSSYSKNFSWFRVLVNDTIYIYDEKGICNFQPETYTSDPFDTLVFDLSQFAGTKFRLSFQTSNRYNNVNGPGGRGDNAFLDNVVFAVPPVVDLGNDRILCHGTTDTLDAGYGAGYQYQWFESGGSGILDTTRKLIVSKAGVYYVVLSDSLGLLATDTVSISFYPVPIANAGMDDSICVNQYASISASASDYKYFAWRSSGDGYFADSNALNTTYFPGNADTANAYTLLFSYVREDSICSISRVDTLILYYKSLPFVSAGSDTNICFGDSLLIGSTALAGFSYEWLSLSDSVIGNTAQIYVSPIFDSAFVLKVTDNITLCSNRDTINVYVKSYPLASFNINDTNQCLNGNNFVFSNNSNGADYYLWDFGNGDTSTAAATSKSYQTSGSYMVKLITTTQYGCKDSTSLNLNVHPHPQAAFSVNDSNQCLNGNTFVFSNTSTGANYYLWDFGDGDTSTAVIPSKTYQASGFYSVKLFSITQFGCKDSISLSLNVHPHPQTAFSVNDTNQCLNGNNFIFTNTSSGADYFLWDFGGGDTSTLASTSKSYQTSGYYTVKLLTNTQYGCKDSISKTIHVKANPKLDLGKDTTICADTSFSLFAGNDYDSWLWSTDEITSSIIVDTSGFGLGKRLVWLEVSKDDCKGRDSIYITFIDCSGSIAHKEDAPFRVFPNPTTDMLFIRFMKEEAYSMELFDGQGKRLNMELMQLSADNQMHQLSLKHLERGIYFLRVTGKSGIYNLRVLKM